ncbi:MAG: class I SAM-dependent methyltransferase [Pirellulales bacterium]
MKPNAYKSMARHEKDNWYYRARARAIEKLIERFVRSRAGDLDILDVGCGTGGTTRLLAKYGRVIGVEPSSLAIDLLRAQYPDLPVVQGTIEDLPDLVPAERFDLATVLGVLCHKGVPDPAAGLAAICGRLREGGRILWGDCVYPCLARQHDEFVDCRRRFYPGQMLRLLRAGGFEVEFASHLLGWAFPVALGMAALHRLKRRWGAAGDGGERLESTDDRPLNKYINAALYWLTYGEWRAGFAGLKAPVGVSYLVIARKLPVRVAGGTGQLLAGRRVARTLFRRTSRPFQPTLPESVRVAQQQEGVN